MSTGPVLSASTLRNIKSQGFLNGIALLTPATQGDATGASSLSWGTGAPTHTAASGAVYIRTDAADSDTVFYRNTDGAATWEAVVGSEVTDLLAANNVWTGTNSFGVSGTGVDVTFFGDTATRDLIWDQSENTLRAQDDARIGFGSGAGTTPDIYVSWNGTKLLVGQLTANSAIDFGASGAGIDMVFYGDTAGRDLAWDQSADSLLFLDNTKLAIGTGSDIVFAWDGTDLIVGQALADSSIKWGVDGAGINHVFYGDTNGRDLVWDQSQNLLRAQTNTRIGFGSGLGDDGDINFAWDGSVFAVTQRTVNSGIRWGIDGAGIDHVFYGDTPSATATWDQSDDALVLAGVAKIKLQSIAPATGTAIPVTHACSFPITQNGAETNTLADPTYIGQQISIFVDTDTSGARVITAASRINQAGNTIITLTEVGDFIKLEAITIAGALKWQVIANDGAVLT